MSAPFKLILMCSVLSISTVAFAADVPDSGRLLRESTPPPSVAPRQEPPILQKPVVQKEQAPAGIKVKVSSFSFKGNTVFSNEKLAALMSSYVGKEMTLAELNAAVSVITNAYRAQGYFLASVNIPPQTIKPDMPITVEIIEGVLEGIRLDTKPSETRTPHTLLQSYVNRVPTGKPAEEGSLSDMIMRVNELPGISSRILLEPGTQAGTTRAQLEVTEGKPYSFSIDTDNHGGYSTGYYRIGSTMELYSPLHMGDQFTLRAQTSFSGDSQSVQTGYTLPVSGSGTKVGLNYSFVTYKLGESFKTLRASGDAHDIILTVTQPLVRSRNLTLNLSLAGEGKLLDDRTDAFNLKNQRHTITGQVGINGVEMDTWLGGGSTSFGLNYIGGVLGIDDSATKSNDQSTFGLKTDGSYDKLAMSLYRNQTLYNDLAFYTGFNGQWAGKNLGSSEQFSLGGPSSVRAFPVSEASCDMGFVYTAELRYLIRNLGVVPGSFQLASFIDHGYAVIHDRPLSPDNTRYLTGVGFGGAWFGTDSFNISTSVAWRTTGTPTGKSEIELPTVYFQAVKRF